ncbi:MAG: hypothetical protein ABSC91_08850 [Candidatus Bathyarchaeia archaeon]
MSDQAKCVPYFSLNVMNSELNFMIHDAVCLRESSFSGKGFNEEEYYA